MPRSSTLRLTLLHELRNEPATSITALAERVGKLRPSVSRSLKVLREENLVAYEDGEWRITPAGEEELDRSVKNLQTAVARSQRSLVALSSLGARPIVLPGLDSGLGPILSGLMPFSSSSKPILFPSLDIGLDSIFPDMRPFFSPFREIAAAVRPFDDSQSGTLGQVLQPLLDAQIENSALARFTLSDRSAPGFSSFVQLYNRDLASAIDDTLALRRLALNPVVDSKLPKLVDFPPVSVHLPAIAASVRALGRELSRQAESTLAMDRPPMTLIAPPTATAAYTRSVRLWYEEDSPAGLPQGYLLGDPAPDIQSWLAALDPSFAEMHRGAWNALQSGGPDSPRHAVVSMRELLRVVLKRLVPDQELSEDGKTRLKARLRKLLGGSESTAEFAASMSVALDGLYDRLNASTHGEASSGVVFGLLLAVDGVLVVVMDHVKHAPPKPG